MPTLEFEGKAFVYSHHLSVPYRELIPVPEKGIGEPSLDGNLIIHGDNLEALKALLPRYAGKVDVIYIDPPYNTGNEGWAYNDNVNSPMMKEWLGKIVDKDDLQRHEKWLCMMWPRLALLRELIHDDGVIITHIDENEIDYLSMIANEVICTGGFELLGQIVWNKLNPKGDSTAVSYQHESILVWGRRRAKGEEPLLRKAKVNAQAMLTEAGRLWHSDSPTAPVKYAEWIGHQKQLSGGERPYNKIDRNGDIYRLVHMGWPNKKQASDDYYKPLLHPISGEACPMPERGWRYPSNTFVELLRGELVTEPDGSITRGIINFPFDNKTQPQRKYLLKDNLFEGVSSITEFGGSDDAYFSELGLAFENPKPHQLARRILSWATSTNSIILDAFAGSGTTAHAALLLNADDGGNRKFICIQLPETVPEGSAAAKQGFTNLAEMTTERVRRVIQGLPEAKDATLRAGLSGSFTYCDLGEAMDTARFFNGAGTPEYGQLARYVIYTATGETVEVSDSPEDGWFTAEAGGYRVHVIYQADKDFLRSPKAALTLDRAREIAASAKAANKPALVFGAAQYVNSKELKKLGITFAQLPWSVHERLNSGSHAPALGAEA